MKACRICLLTEGKFYGADVYQLRMYYEEIIGSNVTMEDNLPQHFCCECAVLLHKYHKFKEKCHRGKKTLLRIFWRRPINYEVLKTIDRKAMNLQSSLDVTMLPEQINVCILKSQSTVKTVVKKEVLEDCTDPKYITEHVNENENSDVHSNGDTDVKNIIPIVTPVLFEIPNTCKKESPSVLENIKTERPQKSTKRKSKTPKKLRNPKESQKPIKTEVLKNQAYKPKYRLKSHGKLIEFTKEDIVSLSKPAARKHEVLNEKYWSTQVLSDEEAIKQNQARSEAEYYMRASYKCTDCFRGFSQKNMLERHQQLRHNAARGKAECRFCHYRFKLPSRLRAHMRQHYEIFKCLRCDYTSNSLGGAEAHDDMHNGVKKTCTHCGEIFRHLTSFYSHLRKIHRSQHICTLCGESFVSEAGLNQHRRVKHFNDTPSVVEGDEEAASTYCETCDITFETRTAFDTHRYHSDKHTEGSDKSLSKRKVSRDSDGDTLLSDIKLKGQNRKVQKRRSVPATCHHCGKVFGSQKAYRLHHSNEHPGHSIHQHIQRRICEFCGAGVAPGNWLVHLNSHTKERLYPCETCGKNFTQGVSLKIHQMIHTGQKPYACSVCPKRFNQSGARNLHYRNVHLKEPYSKKKRR